MKILLNPGRVSSLKSICNGYLLLGFQIFTDDGINTLIIHLSLLWDHLLQLYPFETKLCWVLYFIDLTMAWQWWSKAERLKIKQKASNSFYIVVSSLTYITLAIILVLKICVCTEENALLKLALKLLKFFIPLQKTLFKYIYHIIRIRQNFF